jgi:signal recognition particle subunit SRP54
LGLARGSAAQRGVFLLFEALSEKLQGVFRSLAGQGRSRKSTSSAALREIRLALLEADVHFKVSRRCSSA